MADRMSTYAAGEGGFDRFAHPAALDGVRTARSFAFLIDAAIVLALMLVASIAIAIFGVLTLGLGWLLFPAVWPAVAILYTVLTLGGPASATPGMRVMGVELRTLDGDGMSYGLALLHALGFWFSVTFLTPFILLVALFTPRKQLLHDLVLGVVAVRAGR
jgi:uncharacterized RDD family membrane protein YckC